MHCKFSIRQKILIVLTTRFSKILNWAIQLDGVATRYNLTVVLTALKTLKLRPWHSYKVVFKAVPVASSSGVAGSTTGPPTTWKSSTCSSERMDCIFSGTSSACNLLCPASDRSALTPILPSVYDFLQRSHLNSCSVVDLPTLN